jgi:hypothetical protein
MADSWLGKNYGYGYRYDKWDDDHGVYKLKRDLESLVGYVRDLRYKQLHHKRRHL